jgi:hypothetical protein
MQPIAVVLAGLFLLAGPPVSRAAFHFANIHEVMSGVGADASAQYVEIRMNFAGQQRVAHTRLTAFNCDGSTVTVLTDDLPSDICNAAAGGEWSMATASWATATGVTPDYLFAPGLFAPCGQICWGAPGTILPPEDPSTWDAGNPDNYVDCVAYGGYTGARQTSHGPATSLAPGNGTQSLQRTQDTFDDSADFALSARTPVDNDCPMPTTTTGTTTTGTTTTLTTTTVLSTSTTTTTLPKSKCSSKEIAAAGKKAGGKAKCHAKAAGKGIAVDDGCLTKEEGKFAKAFAKAQQHDDCVAAVSAPAVESQVDAFITELVGQTTAGSSAESKCAAKQIAAGGKKASDKTKCHAKAVKKGLPVDPACLGKAETKFTGAFAKAERKADCLVGDTTAGDVEATVDDFVDGVRGAIAP